MKVKKLIKELKKCDPEAEAIVYADYGQTPSPVGSVGGDMWYIPESSHNGEIYVNEAMRYWEENEDENTEGKIPAVVIYDSY